MGVHSMAPDQGCDCPAPDAGQVHLPLVVMDEHLGGCTRRSAPFPRNLSPKVPSEYFGRISYLGRSLLCDLQTPN